MWTTIFRLFVMASSSRIGMENVFGHFPVAAGLLPDRHIVSLPRRILDRAAGRAHAICPLDVSQIAGCAQADARRLPLDGNAGAELYRGGADLLYAGGH